MIEKLNENDDLTGLLKQASNFVAQKPPTVLDKKNAFADQLTNSDGKISSKKRTNIPLEIQKFRKKFLSQM